MAPLMNSAPLHATHWAGPSAWHGAAGESPVGVTANTVKLYNREQGNLNRLQREAAQNGEVVTEAHIELEYELRGKLLAARSAATEFQSQEPPPDPAPAADQPAPPPAAAPGADRGEPLNLQAMVVDRLSRLNGVLGQAAEAPAESSPPAAALDTQA